jgi:AICAR transformylase/IMP cyclohydrolase PurH
LKKQLLRASESDIIEKKIDIGGISLIRAAAKKLQGYRYNCSVEEYSLL